MLIDHHPYMCTTAAELLFFPGVHLAVHSTFTFGRQNIIRQSLQLKPLQCDVSFCPVQRKPSQMGFWKKALGPVSNALAFLPYPLGFAKVSCFLLQERPPQKNFRSDTTELIYFLVLPKLLTRLHFSLLPDPEINFILWGGFFRLSQSTYRTVRSESKSACTSAALHPMILAIFSLCLTFSPDESFGRSNQVQKRLAWVGYACRNSWRS